MQSRNTHWASCPNIKVSILTRPEGRMQFGKPGNARARHLDVSILTRPEGRMQCPQ